MYACIYWYILGMYVGCFMLVGVCFCLSMYTCVCVCVCIFVDKNTYIAHFKDLSNMLHTSLAK